MHVYDSPENERAFLNTIRQAVAPQVDEQRSPSSFNELFSSKDDRHIEQRIQGRNKLDYQGLISSFQENSIALNLNVTVVQSFEEATAVIEDIVNTRAPEFGKTRHVVQHAHPDLAELCLWERFENTPVSIHTTYPEDPQIRQKTLRSFVGITAADWGISESATLIQITLPERPRSTSLVPSIHIGLLRKSKLLSSLTEAYTMLRRHTDIHSATFISGPSKTADIEAHMVHGAHGPREMHVLIYDDE